MRIQNQIAISITLAAACFAGGYWTRDLRGPTNAQIEDQALTSILENVGYAAYLAKSDFVQMRRLIDINLNNHLSTVVAFQGDMQNSDKGDEFEASKIRTLNAVARLWDERPPFVDSANPTTEVPNAPWIPAWHEKTAQNMQLLAWAKSQCGTRPELQCATASITK